MRLSLFENELKNLERTKVKPNPPEDFKSFWGKITAKIKALSINLSKKRIEFPIDKINAYDIFFSSFDGTKIHGLLLMPPEAAKKKVPVMLSYHGAGGCCGTPDNYSSWILMGIGVLAIDFRMQSGLSGSDGSYGAGTMSFMSMGIMDKEHCALFYMICDALVAIELAAGHVPEFDSSKIGVCGGSQGGGIALAVSALSEKVKLCIADVPSACWFEKRVFDKTGGAAEIAKFIKNRPDALIPIMKNLAYFDNLNFAPMIRCPVLISCGLRDPVCPPAGIYAVYNNIKAEKKIYPYVFAEHEGGASLHNPVKFAFVKEKFFRNEKEKK